GGEAANSDSVVDPTLITSTTPSFGVDAFDTQVAADASGNSDTQAASHPYSASTSLDFNTANNPVTFIGDITPVEAAKDVVIDLPPGFVGNPTTVDQCTVGEITNGNFTAVKSLCPVTSQIGSVLVRLNGFAQTSVYGPLPLFNMVPPPGVPARFAFDVIGALVTLDAKVRSSDYGVSVIAHNTTEFGIQGVTATLWGVPSDPIHDSERACRGSLVPIFGGGFCPSGAPPRAFLLNPTSCAEPGVGLLTAVRLDSWQHPGVFVEKTVRSHDTPGYPLDPPEWGA